MISRTSALTAIAPLKPLLLWGSRTLLWMLRMVAMSTSLGRLRFIHYGGWIAFGGVRERLRHPGLSLWRHRPTMLFLSDYDGDPYEYLAAFGITVPTGMKLCFGAAAGFPGPKPTRTFIEYVQRHSWPAQVRYTAYPNVTVRDLDTALEVARRLEGMAALPAPSQDSLDEEHRALLRVLSLSPEPPPAPSWLAALRAHSTVSGLAVVMPIDPAGRGGTPADLTRLGQDPKALFGAVTGIHFARLAILRLPLRRWPWAPAPPARAEAGHVLFSAWFDGAEGAFVHRLIDGLGDRADDIWGSCAGYPGTDDPERLASWVMAHRLRFCLFLGSRSGVPAERARDALGLVERVRETLLATLGRPPAEVRRALYDLHREMMPT